jgi:hypothetical protein
MRNKNTIELLGLWERLNNPDFKQVCRSLFCLGFVLYPNLKICFQLLLGVETLLSYKT